MCTCVLVSLYCFFNFTNTPLPSVFLRSVAAMNKMINAVNVNAMTSLFTNSNVANAFQNNPLLAQLSKQVPGLMNPSGAMNLLGNEADLHQKLGGARGAVIVPCRARGMAVEHNFKTAYFVIPDGIEHGDELMCSYPACRSAGVKFRYCLHCKVPVAKRNFRNRHRHGVPGGDGGSDSGDEGEDDNLSSEEEEEETTNDAEGATAAGSNAAAPALCMPANEVKKEHLIIIPGADTKSMKKKKKSANSRVPCRARGMPMAHNFKTAYFNIPSNVQHGDELACSFPSCRSAGAKFRYCLHCKVPVAKRNFRNRHKHGNIGDKKKAAKLESPSSQESRGSTNKDELKKPVTDEPKNEVVEQKKESAEEEHLKPSSVPTAEVVVDKAASGLKFAHEESFNSIESAGAASGTVAISSSHDASKVQQWVSLLENKPDPSDKQAMAVWMLNLMNATDGNGGATASVAAAGEGGKAAEAKRDSSPMIEKSEEGSEDVSSSSSQPPKKKFKSDMETEI